MKYARENMDGLIYLHIKLTLFLVRIRSLLTTGSLNLKIHLKEYEIKNDESMFNYNPTIPRKFSLKIEEKV